MNKVKDSDST